MTSCSNILASWQIASICSCASGGNGVAGCRCRSTLVSLAAASLVALIDDFVGMVYKCGENSTVCAICSDLVLTT